MGARAAFFGGPGSTLGVQTKVAFSCQTLKHPVIIDPIHPTRMGA